MTFSIVSEGPQGPSFSFVVVKMLENPSRESEILSNSKNLPKIVELSKFYGTINAVLFKQSALEIEKRSLP